MTDFLSTFFLVDSRLELRRTRNSFHDEPFLPGGFRETTNDDWVRAVTGRRDRWREQADVLGRGVTPQQAPFRRTRIAGMVGAARV
jgi:hypothetical protein